MSIWTEIEQKISRSLGRPFQCTNQVGLAGGSINHAYRMEGQITGDNGTQGADYFIKFNTIGKLEMFEAEAEGLQALQHSGAIRVPEVICTGVTGKQSYLVLENLDLTAGQINSAHRLGQQLAKMHQSTSETFGWLRDNTIGSTKQINERTAHWIDFWREHRLGYQLELAKQKGISHSLYIKGVRLINELEPFFIGYSPVASLLHGDLWSGNVGYLTAGEPVIFDPAVYYGDREVDIAMSELFGGFTSAFYTGYSEIWPLHEGYQQRRNLYNLYHVLNHFNLFGGSYAVQAENILDQLFDLRLSC